VVKAKPMILLCQLVIAKLVCISKLAIEINAILVVFQLLGKGVYERALTLDCCTLLAHSRATNLAHSNLLQGHLCELLK